MKTSHIAANRETWTIVLVVEAKYEENGSVTLRTRPPKEVIK